MAQNVPQPFTYVHGFSPEEQHRLRRQAELAEFTIFNDVDFSAAERLIEVGSGVGAQTEILLRRFSRLKVDCVELNEKQFAAADAYLKTVPYAKDRYSIHHMDAQHLDFAERSFDGAFLCWVLEHVPDPARVLGEVRRVLRPGATVVVNEVMNSSVFLDPYAPNIWRYWTAFNDFQRDRAGDPYIGAKLGDLLFSQGFQRVTTYPKIWHFDKREPGRRQAVLRYWRELLLSAKEPLLAAGLIDTGVVSAMQEEFKQVEAHPNAVIFYGFMLARAQV